jgi:hypothetical protein
MTPFEAEQIVNKYGAALSKGKDDEIARPISLLPCSKSRIRYAYYVYISELIMHKFINSDKKSKLIVTYSTLEHFIPDEEAEKINIIQKKILMKQDRSNEESEIYSEYLNNIFCSTDEMSDFELFIKECKNNI